MSLSEMPFSEMPPSEMPPSEMPLAEIRDLAVRFATRVATVHAVNGSPSP
jgi:hypothetical protein